MSKNIQELTSSLEDLKLPAGNMVELLIKRLKDHPDKTVYILLEDGVNEKNSITYAVMVAMAKAIAVTLLKNGTKGDRVMLLFSTGIEFITSLYGCFFAGMIAVPAYPPRRNKPNERFISIIENSKPAFILSNSLIYEDLNKYHKGNAFSEEICQLVYEEIPSELSEEWLNPNVQADDIALLQYTSGSTGTPNGVMVSHGNIMHNSECIKQSFGFDENSIGVNWLPNFHDMGLIGCLIQAAYLGGSNVIIPPLSFLKNPANWFRMITKYKATTGGGPNFAFDYCMEKVTDEEISEFDLSSLRTLYCGAEPIRKNTLESFTDKFRKAGFSGTQFFPCYGMAESVLITTGGDFKAKPIYLSIDPQAIEENKVLPVRAEKDGRMLTACGYPWLGMGVLIVNPETSTPSPAGEIGEIWVKGPSVAKGYWKDKQSTEKTFNAFISGTEDGPYLRTGDLGFIHEGQLYVSGRMKDLIIIRGSNFYPNDIEHSAENSNPALRQNACAAFSTDIDGEEKLLIVMEVERTHMREMNEEQVFEDIREAVFAGHGIQPHAITLIRTGSILKTSSGKIQRFALRKAWLRQELNEVASWVMKPEKEKADSLIGYRPEFLREWMINWMAHKLEIDPGSIDPDKPVSSYGLDSITAVSLERDVNAQFGVEWPLESFLKENSINQLVREGMDILRRREK
jgi:acyl-CoA synthetase (AMP-forming)/AMP-acid ligase II/acyl carrier protein